MSQKAFFDGIKDDLMEMGMQHIEERCHSAASSIVDPETGKHAEVIVRRTGETSAQLITNGSPAFARELERRLGVGKGEVQTASAERPSVYLAHATENKAELAEPLATRLIESGIDVWLDKWEIGYGDSLRQRMDEGLEKCSHFIVLLTPQSISKAWVNAEIDAGFLRDVDGHAKFIALRAGVEIGDLTPLLQTRLAPEIDLSDDQKVEALIKQLYGHSDKPALGERPSFVQTREDGLEAWSREARLLAEHLVRSSKTGTKFDPQTNIDECASATGMSEEDVRMGLLDLVDAGLVERMDWNNEGLYPFVTLFVEFDRHFLDYDNRQDARTLAKLIVANGSDRWDTQDVKKLVPDWTTRRFNCVLSTLEELRVVTSDQFLGGSNYTYQSLRVTDQTRRFVRRIAD